MTEKETKTTGKKKGKKTKEESNLIENETPKETVEKETKETKKKGSKIIPKPKQSEETLLSSTLLSSTLSDLENKKKEIQENETRTLQ